MQELNTLSNQELLDLHKLIKDFLKYLKQDEKKLENLGDNNAK